MTEAPDVRGSTPLFPSFSDDGGAQNHLLGEIIRQATDAVIVTGADTIDPPGPRILYVNEAFTRMTGYPAEEVIGRSPRFLQGPETDRETTAAIRAGLQREESVRVELLNYRKDGSPFWVEICILPVRNGNGEVSHWSSVHRETSERRTTELQLRDSEARLDSIVSISADAILSIDEEQRITLFNRGAEQIFGYSAAEVIGRPLDILIPEPSREIHRRYGAEFGRSAVESRRMGERGRVSGRRKNGDIFPADVSISKALLDGRIFYSAVLRDITAEVAAEEELRQANADLAALISASPLAVVTLGVDGRVGLWSPAAERMFGWKAEEVVGRPLPIVPAEREGEQDDQVEATRRGRTSCGFESVRLHRDGSRLNVSISVAPLLSATGQVRGLITVFEDITERRRAQDAQRRLTAILEATPDMVSTVDPLGNIFFLNRAGYRLLGLSEDEDLSGRSIPEFHPEWANALILQEALPRAIRTGSWSGETAVLRGAREIPVLQAIIAHYDSTGEVEYLSTVLRDITGRKRVEEVHRFLSEASHELSRTLEYDDVFRRVLLLVVPRMADYFVIDLIDEDGDLRRQSVLHRDPDQQELLEQLCRYLPAEDATLGVRRAIEGGTPELIPDVADAWLRAISRNEEHLAILRKLGPESLLIVPLRARGRIMGALTFAYAGSGRRYRDRDRPLAEDLAGRVALAIDNGRLYREAREATRRRDEVLRVVAHDLRNPLNTIVLSTGILQETAPKLVKEHAGKQLGIIERAAELANDLIQDLLDVAKMEAGKLSIQKKPVATSDLLRQTLEMHRLQAETKGIRLGGEFLDSLPMSAW
jgi:PAS domain S-box-containing protein